MRSVEENTKKVLSRLSTTRPCGGKQVTWEVSSLVDCMFQVASTLIVYSSSDAGASCVYRLWHVKSDLHLWLVASMPNHRLEYCGNDKVVGRSLILHTVEEYWLEPGNTTACVNCRQLM